MRISRAHEQPYRGFAWDHPLREQFREDGNIDPIASEHKTFYTLYEPGFWLGVAAVLFGIFAVWIVTSQTPEPGRSIVSWLFTCIGGAVILVGNKLFRDSYEQEATRFNGHMEKLSGMLGISVELMSHCTWHALGILADEKLVARALEVLKVENATVLCPFDPARLKAKQEFEEMHQLFKKWRLILWNADYTPYFNRAAKRLS